VIQDGKHLDGEQIEWLLNEELAVPEGAPSVEAVEDARRLVGLRAQVIVQLKATAREQDLLRIRWADSGDAIGELRRQLEVSRERAWKLWRLMLSRGPYDSTARGRVCSFRSWFARGLFVADLGI